MVHSGYDLVENFFEQEKRKKSGNTDSFFSGNLYFFSKEHCFSNAEKSIKICG